MWAAMVSEALEQVEAEWGDLTTTWQPADELLLDLEARKVELQAEKGESRRVQMAKRSVELVLAKVGLANLAGLGPEAHHEAALRAGNADAEALEALLAMHEGGAMPLLLEHIEQVVYDTEPIEVGEFQMRMPPMVGKGDIAIPLLFLQQVYAKSVAFGFSLGGAAQRRQLDASLRSFNGMGGLAALSNEAMDAGEGDGGVEAVRGPEVDGADGLGTLAQYLYGAHGTRAEMLYVREQVPRQVADDHTHRLFGHPVALSVQVDRVLRFAASPEEAQESLDNALCTGGIPWERVPAAGLRYLIAEALLFGRVLSAVDSQLPVDW